MSLAQAGIELTTRCSRRCEHCLRRATPREMVDFHLGLLESLVPELAARGATHVGLTGGEPLLHPRIAEAGSLLARLGVTFHIVTGGGHAAQLRALIDASGPALRHVAVSLEGATAEVHDACRGEGAFTEALQTLSLCVSREVPVVAQTTITRLNAGQIEAIALLARDLGACGVRYAYCHPYGPAKELALDAEGRQSAAGRIAEIQSQEPTVELAATDMASGPRCRFLDLDAVFIDARGRLLYCCLLAGLCPDGTDGVADLARTPLRTGIRALEEAYGRFRAHLAAGEVALEHLDPREVPPCGLCARWMGVRVGECTTTPL